VFHRFKHPGNVQARLGIHFCSPSFFKLGAQLRIFDVLKSGEAVRDGAHVAAALNIILAAERIDAAAVTADVSSEQSEIDERENIVHGVVVFCDSQRPAHLGAARFCIGVGDFAYQRSGHPGFTFGALQRVFFNGVAIGFKSARGVPDELLVGQAGMNDLARHGVSERDVGADVESQPSVRELGRARAARIHHDELRAAACGLQQMVEQDRVRLAGVGTPQKNKIGLCHFLIRTGGAARAEDRRQTGDAGRVSSSVATVNIVAADDRTHELLRDVIQLVGRFRATEHAKRARAVLRDLAAQSGRNAIERLFPACRPVAVGFANQRSSEPAGRDRRHLKLPPESVAESLGLENGTKGIAPRRSVQRAAPAAPRC